LIVPGVQQIGSPDLAGWVKLIAFGSIGLSVGLIFHSIGRAYLLRIKE
jgi:hypothetical protein